MYLIFGDNNERKIIFNATGNEPVSQNGIWGDERREGLLHATALLFAWVQNQRVDGVETGGPGFIGWAVMHQAFEKWLQYRPPHTPPGQKRVNLVVECAE
jgi:hypothetical protein